MTFNVSEKDWADAEEALIGKPSGTKFDKYPTDPDKKLKVQWLLLRNHSFIILNETIYALSNKHSYTPIERNNSILKKGITKDGKEVTIRIKSWLPENKPSQEDKNDCQNYLILEQGIRIWPKMKITLPNSKKVIVTDHKLYTIIIKRPPPAVIFTPFQLPDIFLGLNVRNKTIGEEIKSANSKINY